MPSAPSSGLPYTPSAQPVQDLETNSEHPEPAAVSESIEDALPRPEAFPVPDTEAHNRMPQQAGGAGMAQQFVEDGAIAGAGVNLDESESMASADACGVLADIDSQLRNNWPEAQDLAPEQTQVHATLAPSWGDEEVDMAWGGLEEDMAPEHSNAEASAQDATQAANLESGGLVAALDPPEASVQDSAQAGNFEPSGRTADLARPSPQGSGASAPLAANRTPGEAASTVLKEEQIVENEQEEVDDIFLLKTTADKLRAFEARMRWEAIHKADVAINTLRAEGQHDDEVWADAATWSFCRVPSASFCVDFFGYQADGDTVSSGPVLQISLKDHAHEEHAGHTWYMISCTLALRAVGPLEWNAPRRLTQLRAVLYSYVKTVLGDAYAARFKGTPFAKFGAPPGTTARLTAWLQNLADVINGGGVPSKLVSVVLAFLHVPIPAGHEDTERRFSKTGLPQVAPALQRQDTGCSQRL